MYRFSNNGLTYGQIAQLTQILSHDNCPIVNLFIDWNPIYADGFKAGPVPDGTNKLYHGPEDSVSPFA